MSLPVINNAFENIQTTCQNRLEHLYPKGIPEDIYSRYQKELSFLEQSSYIDDFELYRRLSDETKKNSTIISARGTLSGSILYYLLGNNSFNPLPPYYYCTACGYYEAIDTDLFGIDLPPKKCPHCGAEILADGFNLPIESVWGITGKKSIAFDYNVNSEFLPFAKRVLQIAYPHNTIVPWGMFQMDPSSGTPYPDERIIGVGLAGYGILPTEHTLQDYPDLISYLENGDACITGGSWELKEHMLKPIRLFTLEYLDKLIQLQRATGVYANDLNIKELREITWSNIYNTAIPNSTARMLFHEFRPKTYKDMVAYDSSSHNSFIYKNAEHIGIDFVEYKKMISTPEFQKYPCHTREDFFDHMVKMGVDRTLAFDASERIRKGHALSQGNFRQQFLDLPIPDEIKKIAQNYRYIFPRAHGIAYILIYARLAYYAKIDSRSFSKIIFKKH